MISARLPPLLLLTTALLAADPALPLRFVLGPGPAAPGTTRVAPSQLYGRDAGYGYEPGPLITVVEREHATDAPCRGFVTAATPFHFTARVPREGNYRVSVRFGDPAGSADLTIKAELRRLMVERVTTRAGECSTVHFTVNVRTPVIPPADQLSGGRVQLKAPRETVQEAWAWDEALTLEFLGPRIAVCGVTIEPVSVPTVFLLGDSTVCDQSKEPYASWGQMLTRFFKPTVAVANHGESGETYRDSLARRRLDKILSALTPGDWVIMQFGHNDQKQIAAGTGAPFTTYKDELAQHVRAVRDRGGLPIVVSPMERRGFGAEGGVKPSLASYATAAREAATELGVPFIDLNAMSKALYAALGPDASAKAFAAPNGVIDNTHHNNFGSYELAKCIAAELAAQKLPLAAHLVDDFAGFDPARPDDPDTFALPPSAEFTNQRPLGD